MIVLKKQHLFQLLTILCVLVRGFIFSQAVHLESQIIETIEIVFAAEPVQMLDGGAQMIKNRLKTREGDVFSQTGFDSDLKMLAQEYDRIEPIVESVDNKMRITLKLWPKPIIKSIVWRGNERIKIRALQAELGIAKGDVLDRQKFNQAFHKIKAYYIQKGYFEAELDYFVDYNEATNEVDIRIDITEGRAGKIRKIVFCNFSRQEQFQLLEMMATKRYNFFLTWLTGQGTYNEEMIEHDKFIILNYLQNKGFADAVVKFDICEVKDDNNRIIIRITADRGASYYFGNIKIEGNELFPTQELYDAIPIRPGLPFSPEALHRSIEILTNRYGKSGYIEAMVNFEPKLSETECIYDVDLSIEEGEQYRVGLIKVMGNCRTQTNVILHETLLIPGEVFNLEKLKITEARLCNIGYFEHVNVYAVKSEADSLLSGNYRDVHIEVEEANTGHLNAFFGFSSSESMFGGVSLTERNFNARGLCSLWSEGLCALRGGGEYTHITVSLGNKTSSCQFSWTKPHFNDTPWSVGFDLEKGYNKYIADDYEIYTYGLTVHGTYDCNQYMRLRTHYRLKYGDTKIHHHKDKDGEEKKDDECRELKEQARNDGLISALGVTCLYDSTDSFLRPTRGYKSRIEGEIAGLGGDRSFLATAYLNSYYYHLWGYGVLKLRADVRFIQPLGQTGPDDIPLDERFFLGGDCDIRGYRAYRLGPKFCDKDDDPKGGISQQIFSVELSKTIIDCADVFAFFDSGSLSMRKWKFGRYYHSVGYGARLRLFQGTPPLTFGMGYPLNAKDKSEVKRFFITIGGKF